MMSQFCTKFNLGLSLRRPFESQYSQIRRFAISNPTCKLSFIQNTFSNFAQRKLSINEILNSIVSLNATKLHFDELSKLSELVKKLPVNQLYNGGNRKIMHCPKCAANLFHPACFEFPSIERCPIHNELLSDSCPVCNKVWPDLGEMFRRDCPHCCIQVDTTDLHWDNIKQRQKNNFKKIYDVETLLYEISKKKLLSSTFSRIRKTFFEPAGPKSMGFAAFDCGVLETEKDRTLRRFGFRNYSTIKIEGKIKELKWNNVHQQKKIGTNNKVTCENTITAFKAKCEALSWISDLVISSKNQVLPIFEFPDLVLSRNHLTPVNPLILAINIWIFHITYFAEHEFNENHILYKYLDSESLIPPFHFASPRTIFWNETKASLNIGTNKTEGVVSKAFLISPELQVKIQSHMLKLYFIYLVEVFSHYGNKNTIPPANRKPFFSSCKNENFYAFSINETLKTLQFMVTPTQFPVVNLSDYSHDDSLYQYCQHKDTDRIFDELIDLTPLLKLSRNYDFNGIDGLNSFILLRLMWGKKVDNLVNQRRHYKLKWEYRNLMTELKSPVFKQNEINWQFLKKNMPNGLCYIGDKKFEKEYSIKFLMNYKTSKEDSKLS
jgi:hypothetical protein